MRGFLVALLGRTYKSVQKKVSQNSLLPTFIPTVFLPVEVQCPRQRMPGG